MSLNETNINKYDIGWTNRMLGREVKYAHTKIRREAVRTKLFARQTPARHADIKAGLAETRCDVVN
jgi:hypothetical protein